MTFNHTLRIRIRNAAGLTALLVGAAACNENKIVDYNALTAFPKSINAVQNGMTGVFNGPRGDIGFFTLAMDGFARNAAYYTPSEERFVTQLTGQTLLDDDNFGAGVWTGEFNAVKSADSVEALVTSLSPASIPVANANALLGAAEVFKAYDFMLIAESHDTVGVVMNEVGSATPNAPVLCNADVWNQIIQMLDSAMAYERAAGPGTTFGIAPGTGITLPPSFGSSLQTSDGWLALAHALRGMASVEYAYAAARTPPAGSFGAPGTPDPTLLNQAIADIEDSSGTLYVAPGALSPTNAVASPATDPGIYHDYSTASGDQSNPIATNASATYVLLGALAEVDTLETAWQAKWVNIGTTPATLAGGVAASSWTLTGPASYSVSSPIPMVRDLELQFYVAAAQLGLGETAASITTIQNVRVNVGAVPAETVPNTVAAAQNFLINEARANLAFDGTGDVIIFIRDFGLVNEDLTTWGSADFKTSMEVIPLPEQQGRGGNFAHAACTTTPP